MGNAERVQPRWIAIATITLACVLAGCASAPEPWPERVVRPEEVPALTRMPMRVLYNTREVERGQFSTVVLRVHVDAQGQSRRAVVSQSSGISELDEAALNAVRDARFKPFVHNGASEDVTLVLPMHFPLRKRAL